MSESNIDRALGEAFGASSRHSVLRVIERITGEAPRILLRDSESENGASPIIDASSIEKRAIPQGRGSYQILGEIARGGMGVVMKGHDTDLGRDVAMKVLHKELAKRPEVLQRFVEEAQIGGQLQHPGIVPVYELGLMADERPYFTIKLVKGRTLAALLAERKSADVDRRKLLDVFESVCQTMAYAHSRGVIHRDLKPANVMVGAFGEVQVVDWGLAKVLRHGGTADEKRQKQTNISIIETVRSEPGSHGSHSLVGSVMGTPAYMSPEQARGEIAKLDERSDVFSLGAILCEILTGAPPYLGESEKTLIEAASAKLDDATKRLDGCEADAELVALCRECLTPAQSARPRSAEVVAQRIHGYLISVEERARQAQVDAAEARVKAQEERRARKLTVGLAASVLVTVLVAGGGWAWMSSEKSRRERDTETQVSTALSEATLKRGEGDWAGALAAAERARGLADSGAASNELRARVASDLAAIGDDARLAHAKDELTRDNTALLVELADVRQPEGDKNYPTDWAKLDADHRTIFTRHGFELDEQNQVDAADALNERGISVELAAVLDEWASVRSRAKDKAGASHLLDIARRIDDDATRTELRYALLASDTALLKTFIAMEDPARFPATTLLLLGKALRGLGAMNEAISVLRQAQQLHPGDFMLAMSLARALFYADPALPEEAARFYTAALALRPNSVEAAHELGLTLNERLQDPERAMELFRNAVVLHPVDGHLRAHLAACLTELGNRDAALAAAREASVLAPNDRFVMTTLGVASRKADDLDSAIAAALRASQLDPEDSRLQLNLGQYRKAKGDLDGALEAFRKAIKLDGQDASGYTGLGHVLRMKGELDAALDADRKAVDLEPKSPDTWIGLGYDYLRLGEFDKAIEAVRKAIDLDGKSSVAYRTLGLALFSKREHDRAVVAYQKAVELDPNDSVAFWDLALALQRIGNVEDAIRAARKATELAPKYVEAHCTLGVLLETKDDVVGAIGEYRRTIELDAKHPSAHAGLGTTLRKQGHLDRAIEEYRTALICDPKVALTQVNLGRALHEKGNFGGAIDAYDKAIALDPNLASAYGDLGQTFAALGEHERAIASYRRAIDGGCEDVSIVSALVWLLATCEDRSLRDGAEAVQLAQFEIELAPTTTDAFNDLGVALCCKAEWLSAIEALERSVQLERAGDDIGPYRNAINDCFLAIAHAHLGELDKARAELALANTWHEANPRHADAAQTVRFLDDARAAIEY